MSKCLSCRKNKGTATAVVEGIYYRNICNSCLGREEISSNAASYARRRDYEDNAQDTIQPYDAGGNPRVEFLRLYPIQARRVYSKEVVEELKKKL